MQVDTQTAGNMLMFVPGGKKSPRGPGRDESEGIRSVCTGGDWFQSFSNMQETL